MDEQALRMILLVQAVEESDSNGELLLVAERAEATQSLVLGEAHVREAFAGDALSDAGERWLTRRAAHLHERLQLRAPVTGHLLAVAGGSRSSNGLMGVAVLVGVLLGAVDGRGHIDILGFALLGLVAWNLSVYALLLANCMRPRLLSGAGVARLYARWLAGRAQALLRRSRAFNAPLAAALPRFATDWGALSRALVLHRAQRIFHVCAALVAVGFIAGVFVRGEVLRDAAGWSGSLLGATPARVFLHLLYAPAAAIAGIALPAAPEVAALHAADGAGGVPSLPWISLIALTLVIYVIAPRALLAAAHSVRIWRIGARMAVPASVLPYARRTLVASAAPAGTL